MDLSPRYSTHIVDEEEDCPKFFGSGSEFRTTNGQFIIEWEPIEYIADMEMNICFFGEIRTVTSIPPFMSPEIIHEIHFDSFISHSNFVTLLTPLIHLKLLEIHLSSLENLNFCNNGISPIHFMDLPNLECLEISSTNYSYYHALHSNMKGIIQNISTILTTPNNFPCLIYLSISVPTFLPMDEDLARSILKCVIKHKLTLKYLNIEAEYTLHVHDCNENIYNNDETFYNNETTLLTNKKHLSLSLLKSAESVNLSSFHFFSLVRSPSTEIWGKFIQSQENLQYLQFWCEEYYYNWPQDVLERNDSLIHTIALNINVKNNESLPIPMLPINLQIFHECPYLKIIYLKGNNNTKLPVSISPSPSTSTEKSTPADIKNADMLPETLEFIKLINLYVDKDDVHFIATGLPNLKDLYLKDIGEDGNFGLLISDLNTLLQKNGIQKIEIISSINRNSLSEKNNMAATATAHESMMGAGGYEIISKILFSKQEKISFRVMANFEGGFDPISDDEDEDEDEDGDDEELVEDDDGDEGTDLDLEEETVKVQEEPWNLISILEEVVPTKSTTSAIVINENSLVDYTMESTSIVIPKSILSVVTTENILGVNSHSYKHVDFKENNVEQETSQEENEQSVISLVDSTTTSQNKQDIIPTISQMINPDRRSSDANASTSHGSTIEVPPGIELVDEDEANLDIFVKDFSTYHEPPS